jgi:hypothetical protein
MIAGIALFIVIALLVALMVLDRLWAGKRQRQAQAEMFEQLRTSSQVAATEPQVEVPPPPPESHEDFPVGVAVPGGDVEQPEPAAPAPSSLAEPAETELSPATGPSESLDDDAEIDYWEDDKGKRRRPAIVGGMVSGDDSAHAPSATEDDSGIISADLAFGGEQPGLELPAEGEELPAPAGEVRRDGDEFDAGPATGGPLGTTEPEPALSISPEALQDDEGPITLDGVSYDAPEIEPAEDLDDAGGEKRQLREAQRLAGEGGDATPEDQPGADAAPSEPNAPSSDNKPDEIPFTLDLPLEDTKTQAEGAPGSSPARDTFDEPGQDEPSLPVDDDFPLSGGSGPQAQAKPQSLLSDTMVLDRDEPPAGQPPAAPAAPAVAPRTEPPAAPPEDIEEILITPGRPSGTDQTAPLAGDEISSESTMIDSRSRHKAVYQDQLARGLAAMEKGHWNDAVKFLSVAHAMDPTSDYANDKLREARERRDAEAD